GALFDADGDGVPEPRYYNGFQAGIDLTLDAEQNVKARALGIEHMAAQGVQGRGVLVDLHSTYGTKRHEVGYEDLMRILERDGVVIEPGDIVCFWTGLDRLIL